MNTIYDYSGLKLRLIFSRWRYAPHYVEEVTDPLDNRVKLVMADPHIRHSVYIYDPSTRLIVWVFRVAG